MRKLNILEMNRISAEQYKQVAKTPLTVVLDDVRSTYNVGSVFRSADAFRIERICLCGITPQPPHPEIHKTALGAELSVEWTYNTNTLQQVTQLKAEGYTLYAVEQAEGSIMLNQLAPQLPAKCAIILGNEVKGVRQDVIDQCDACIEIPQYGTKHSLNVSTAAGIVMWEMMLRLKM